MSLIETIENRVAVQTASIQFVYHPILPDCYTSRLPDDLGDLPECLSIRENAEFVENPDNYLDKVQDNEPISRFSGLNPMDKATEEAMSCFAVFMVGQGLDGIDYSLLAHITKRDFNKTCLGAKGPWDRFADRYKKVIEVVRSGTVQGTRVVALMGSYYRFQSCDLKLRDQKELSRQYFYVIDQMRQIHEPILGVESLIFQGKMYRGTTNVYTSGRTLHIVETGQFDRTQADVCWISDLKRTASQWDGNHIIRPVTWIEE